VAKSIGSLIFTLDARHRRVALDNLAEAFPGSDAAWRRRTARSSFRHLGRLLFEITTQDLLPSPSPGWAEGFHHLEAAANGGRGYFLVSAHFGNWERIAFLQGAAGFPVWMVARPLDNPRLETYFRARREGSGNRVVYKRNALREIVKGLRGGAGIAFLIDQNFGEEGGLFVDFFGRPAATTPALGRIAVRTGAPAVPVFSFPLSDGNYRVVYGPPMPPPDTGDKEADALEFTRAVTKKIEEAVRECPGAWFWMHRRWRTRPDKDKNEPPRHEDTKEY
jgi:KDO2-lipid IV(A) lauroyltransferase